MTEDREQRAVNATRAAGHMTVAKEQMTKNKQQQRTANRIRGTWQGIGDTEHEPVAKRQTAEDTIQ